jgi:AraC family transcriptional regulator of adaptative response / DNA-3-methyladenine glycosylase II
VSPNRTTTDDRRAGPPLDHAACYEAIRRRDARFDGRFYTAVTTTGIFCRPSCPARTPRSTNVRFFAHAAAASEAGFRPCRRCRPELAPGHPEWNRRADLAGRAVALIERGVVDRDGVAGLAARLGVSERHLRRELGAEVGAGPIQLARTRRLWLARILLDQTNLTITDVAFASGFGSVRQFNDAFRQAFATTPSSIRRRPDTAASGATELTLTLAGRGPVGWEELRTFLASRAVAGLEAVTSTGFRRGIPGGWVELAGLPGDDGIRLRCCVDRLDRVAELVPLVRRVADLDTDRAAVADHLRDDPDLAARLDGRPPPPLPGAFDPFEVAVRAVVGQQVSVAGAATTLARLVDLATGREGDDDRRAGPGDGDGDGDGIVHRGFPTAEQVAAAPLERLGMPGRRRDTIRAVAEAVAEGRLDLSPAADRAELESHLLALPGVGPWTAGYIAMRGLGDPDGWPTGDLVLRRSVSPTDGPTVSARELEARAERWRPWRAYGAMVLWATAGTFRPRHTISRQTDDEREVRP